MTVNSWIFTVADRLLAGSLGQEISEYLGDFGFFARRTSPARHRSRRHARAATAHRPPPRRSVRGRHCPRRRSSRGLTSGVLRSRTGRVVGGLDVVLDPRGADATGPVSLLDRSLRKDQAGASLLAEPSPPKAQDSEVWKTPGSRLYQALLPRGGR